MRSMLNKYLLYGPQSLVAYATVYSQQTITPKPRTYPISEHGKIRFAYFYYKNETGGTLADGTEIDLCNLPKGRVRVLPALSRITASAMSTSRTLDIGHRAYDAVDDDQNAADVIEDDDAFVANLDISSAVNAAAWGTTIKFDIYSRAGVRLYATVDGGTIPANGIVEGFVAYVYE